MREKIKRKKKEISPMKFTFLIAKKIDEILNNKSLNSEQKIVLIQYYMNKYREEDKELEEKK